MTQRLTIDEHEDGGTCVVRPRGDIDLAVSQDLRRLLLARAKAGHELVVDMSGVGYIDSSGIASLIEAFQTTRQQNLRFALAAVPERAMRVLKLARLDRVLPLMETVDPSFGDPA
jgi:anti-sigma B factor antagonist